MPPAGDLACNPGMCPDQELNRRPLGLWDDAQPTEPHQSGQKSFFWLYFDLTIKSKMDAFYENDINQISVLKTSASPVTEVCTKCGAQVVCSVCWALSHKSKVTGLIPGQGTMCLGNRPMFLSCVYVSLPLFLPTFPSLKSKIKFKK